MDYTDLIGNGEYTPLQRKNLIQNNLLEKGIVNDPFVASMMAWGVMIDDALEKIK